MCKTPAARLAREGDLTLGQCKQGVVFTHTDILAGVELGATLTNDDVAGDNSLTTEFLDPETATC